MNRKHLNRIGLLPLFTAAVATMFAACDDRDGRHASTLVGVVDQGSFAYPVTRVIVTGDDGNRGVASVHADGSFVVELSGNHRYSVDLDTDLATYPLVLAGSHGRYVRELHVKSGGGWADLGSIRYFNPAETPYSASDLCVDGFYEDSLEPCMSGPADSSCGYSAHDGHDRYGDGRRAETPLYVDLDAEMAVPTFSLETSLGCRSHGDDDDGRDDDGGYDNDSGWDDDDGWEDDD
jgi:hypothetical protein